MIDLKDIASSPRTQRLSMAATQYMPEGIGHRLSWFVAGLLTRLKPAVYEVVQTNLKQVLGSGVEAKTLEQAVRQVFYTTMRGYFDLFRAVRLPHEQLVALVELSEEARAVARSLWKREGGSVLVFPHLGNFDLGGQAAAAYLPETQVLTLPNPPPGFQMANEIRRRSGVQVTPLSSVALRQAIQLLRRGGVVSLAGDRPVSDLDELVSFFGSPARVPSGHVRLALRTGAVVVVICCVLSPDTGRYTVHFEPPIEMIRTGNRNEEVQLNMRRVLDALEAVIRRWPEQWQMYVPVWPRLLEA